MTCVFRTTMCSGRSLAFCLVTNRTNDRVHTAVGVNVYLQAASPRLDSEPPPKSDFGSPAAGVRTGNLPKSVFKHCVRNLWLDRAYCGEQSVRLLIIWLKPAPQHNKAIKPPVPFSIPRVAIGPNDVANWQPAGKTCSCVATCAALYFLS